MAIAPIGAGLPIPPLPSLPTTGTAQAATPGFGDAMANGLMQVSGLEHRADALIADVAAGGPTKIHEVMAATTQSSLAVDMLVQVRDQAMNAYQEIMRLQL
jgi:flagellar hook-basal body complex protein FliE